MLFRQCLVATVALLVPAIHALTQGDIVLVSYGSQSQTDKLTLVTTVDLPVGTKFTLTDRGWLTSISGCDDNTRLRYLGDSSHFTRTISPDTNEAVGDGYIVYTSPGLHAGDVIEYQQGSNHPNWDTTYAGDFFQSGGDQIIIYEGTEPSPCFIWAWTNTQHGWRLNYVKDGQTAIEGAAVDMETDSDYPINADPQWVCHLSTLVDHMPVGNLDISTDNGAATCGTPGQAITWPSLALSSRATYLGPVVGTLEALREFVSRRIFFSNDPHAVPADGFTFVDSPVVQVNQHRRLASADATPLEAGDVVVTDLQIGRAGPHVFRLALLKSIEEGTEFYVTDRGYDNTAGDFVVITTSHGDTTPVANEGVVKFKASRTYYGGEIVTYPGTDFTDLEGELSFQTGGDSLIIFQPNVFLTDPQNDALYDFIWLVSTQGPSMVNLSPPTEVQGTDIPNQLQAPVAPDYHCSTYSSYQLLDNTLATAFYYNGLTSGVKEGIICAILNPSMFGTTAPSPPIDHINFETTFTNQGIRIVHYNSLAGYDRFVVVFLEIVASGTKIEFTDHGVTSTGDLTQSPNDGWVTFTAAKNLPVGTTIEYPLDADTGTWSTSTLNLDPTADSIIALQLVNGFRRYRTAVIWGRMWGESDPIESRMSELPDTLDSLSTMEAELQGCDYCGPVIGTTTELAGAMTNNIFCRGNADNILAPEVFNILIVDEGNPQLEQGDLAIVLWDKDEDARVSIVTLVDLPVGLRFYMTDIGYNAVDSRFNLYPHSNSFVHEEGVVLYVVSQPIPAGSIISESELWKIGFHGPAPWYKVRGNIRLGDAKGDQLFLFQLTKSGDIQFIWGTDFSSPTTSVEPDRFVTDGFLTTDTDDQIARSGVPTGLTSTVQLPCLDSNGDEYKYYRWVGRREGTKPMILESLMANFLQVDGRAELLVGSVAEQAYEYALATSPEFPIPDEAIVETTLLEGQLFFISVSPQAFSFIVLVDTFGGTTVSVSDAAWNSAAFPFGETLLHYTFPNDTSIGTIVNFDGTAASNPGWTIDPMSAQQSLALTFAMTGDSLIVFQPSTAGSYDAITAVRFGPQASWPYLTPEPVPATLNLLSDGDGYAQYAGPTVGTPETLSSLLGSPRLWRRSGMAFPSTPDIMIVQEAPVQPTVLSYGEVAFVAVTQNLNSLDFALVVLKDLGEGTTFLITTAQLDDDQELLHGTVMYTAPAGGVSAGTIITFTPTSSDGFTVTEEGAGLGPCTTKARTLDIYQINGGVYSPLLTRWQDCGFNLNRRLQQVAVVNTQFLFQYMDLDPASTSYVYTGPRTGDLAGLFSALSRPYFWTGGGSSTTSLITFTILPVAVSPAQPLHPGDVVITCIRRGNNDDYSLILTVTVDLQPGTTFYVTNNVPTELNGEFTGFNIAANSQGTLSFQAAIFIPKGTELVALASSPAQWRISHQGFVPTPTTDIITVFQFDMSSNIPERPLWLFASDSVSTPASLASRVTVLPLMNGDAGATYRGPSSISSKTLTNTVADSRWWFQGPAADFSCNVQGITIAPIDPPAMTPLEPGEIIIIRAEQNPTFVFDAVLLVPTGPNTEIYFSVNGVFTIRFRSSVSLAAGTILTYDHSAPGANWMVAGSPFGTGSNEWTNGGVDRGTIEVFQFSYGADVSLWVTIATPTPLSAMDFLALRQGDPLELIFGTIFSSTITDNFQYVGPTSGDATVLAAAVADEDFWRRYVDASVLPLPAGINPTGFLVGNLGTELFEGDVSITFVQQVEQIVDIAFLVDVAASTQIFLRTSAGLRIRYTVPAGGLTAGTVVSVEVGALDATQVTLAAGTSFDFTVSMEFTVFQIKLLADLAEDGATFLWGLALNHVPMTSADRLRFSFLVLDTAGAPPNFIGYAGASTGYVNSIRAAIAEPNMWLFSGSSTFRVDALSFEVIPANELLSPGHLAIVEYRSDASDSFSVLALNSVPEGTVLFFTDIGSDGTNLQAPIATDGVLKCVVAQTISQGVIFQPLVANAYCEASSVSGDFDLPAPTDPDQVCIFQWAATTTPSYIWCFDNSGTWEDETDAVDATTSQMPEHLDASSSAILPYFPFYRYNGVFMGSPASLQAAIGAGGASSTARRLFAFNWFGTSTESELADLDPTELQFSIDASVISSQLDPGCLAVVAYETTGFTLVVLSELVPGSQFYVTDHGYAPQSDGLFTTATVDEGIVEFTVGDMTLAPGTTIPFAPTDFVGTDNVYTVPNAGTWRKVSGEVRTENFDSLIIFQYYDVTFPTFLWAFKSGSPWDPVISPAMFGDSLLSENPFTSWGMTAFDFETSPPGTGLELTVNGLFFSNPVPTVSGTKDQLVTAISNAANWDDTNAVTTFIVETELNPCDIAVVSVAVGSFQIVTLIPINVGTEFSYTNRGYNRDPNTGGFNVETGASGIEMYTFGADTPAGTVITITPPGASWPLATDTILLYRDDDSVAPLPIRFIWGTSTQSWATSGFSLVDSTSVLPSELLVDICHTEHAPAAPSSYDAATAGFSGTQDELTTLISKSDNWISTPEVFDEDTLFSVHVDILEPGCIAPIYVRSHESLDHLQLLLLENIQEGTKIFVSDRGWSLNGFISHDEDCTLLFTAPHSMYIGDVLTWVEPSTGSSTVTAELNAANGWSTIGCQYGFKISNQGESILIYHGSDVDTPYSFLWGFFNNGQFSSPALPVPTDQNELQSYSILPQSIVEFSIALDGFDNYKFVGPRCGSKELFVAALVNPLFWIGDSDFLPGQDVATVLFSARGDFEFTDLCPHNVLIEGPSLAVVHYDAQDPAADGFSLLALTDIPADSVIWVTDAGWESSSGSFPAFDAPPSATEGLLQYQFPALLEAGNVITWTPGAAGWMEVKPGFNLAPSADQLLVFVVANMDFPNFLWAFDGTRTSTNVNGFVTGALADVETESNLPAELRSTVQHTALSAEFERWVYSGPRDGSVASLVAAIGQHYDPSNARRRLIESFWLGTSAAGALDIPTTGWVIEDNIPASGTTMSPGDAFFYFVDPIADAMTNVFEAGNLQFSLVILVDLEPGTQFFVTDRRHDASTASGFLEPDEDGFRSEGTLRLDVTTGVEKGTFIHYPAPNNAGYSWEVTDEGFDIAIADELYLFQWTPTSTTPEFILMLQTCDTTNPDCNPTAWLPAGLTFTCSGPVNAYQSIVADVTGGGGFDWDGSYAQSVCSETSGTPQTYQECFTTSAPDFTNVDSTAMDPTFDDLVVQTDLEVGDVAIVSMDYDEDHFQVILRKPVCEGTTFYVGVPQTPAMWSVGDAEFISYTAQTDLKAGTIISFTGELSYWAGDLPDLTSGTATIVAQPDVCDTDSLFAMGDLTGPFTPGLTDALFYTNVDDRNLYQGNFFIGGTSQDDMDFEIAVEDVDNWLSSPMAECQSTEACDLGSPLDANVVLGAIPTVYLGDPTVITVMFTNVERISEASFPLGDSTIVDIDVDTAEHVTLLPGGVAVVQFTHTYGNVGLYDVSVIGASSAVQMAEVVLRPQPIFTLDPIDPVDEGTVASTLSGSIMDIHDVAFPTMVVIEWGDGTTDTVTSDDFGYFNADHLYLDDAEGPDDTYMVYVTVTNTAGLSKTELATAVVRNVVPTVTLDDVSLVVPVIGTVFVTGTLTDLNAADTFSNFVIFWGDGTMSSIVNMDPDHVDLVSWDPTTGAFVARHEYLTQFSEATIVVLVTDDDGGISQAVNLPITTVPQHAVQGGVVMQMVGSCDSISLTMMTLPQLNELQGRIAALLSEDTNTRIEGNQILLISLMCQTSITQRRLADVSDGVLVVVVFKVLGLTDQQAITVGDVLLTFTGSSVGPLVAFNITATFGDPMMMTCDCDDSCLTCAVANSANGCTSCPVGSLLQGGYSPGVCEPMPTPTTSASPSASPSASGSDSYTATGSESGSVSTSASAAPSAVTGSATGSSSASSSASASTSNSASVSLSASASASASASDSLAAVYGQNVDLSGASLLGGGNSPDGHRRLLSTPDEGAEAAEDSSFFSSLSPMTSIFLAAVAAGVFAGIIVVGAFAVFVQRKPAAPVVSPTASGGAAPKRRRAGRKKTPPQRSNMLWKVMHSPQRRVAASPENPESPA